MYRFPVFIGLKSWFPNAGRSGVSPSPFVVGWYSNTRKYGQVSFLRSSSMLGTGIKVYLTKIYPGQNPFGHIEMFQPHMCKVGGLPELLQLVIKMRLQIVNVHDSWWIFAKHSCNNPNGSIFNMARGPSVASYNGLVSGLLCSSFLVNSDG